MPSSSLIFESEMQKIDFYYKILIQNTNKVLYPLFFLLMKISRLRYFLWLYSSIDPITKLFPPCLTDTLGSNLIKLNSSSNDVTICNRRPGKGCNLSHGYDEVFLIKARFPF